MNGNFTGSPKISWSRLSCFQFVKRMNGNSILPPTSPFFKIALLPIREAYEWKLIGFLDSFCSRIELASNSWSVWMETSAARLPCTDLTTALASNSWSVWMETYPPRTCGTQEFACFQFVKRMNGNPKGFWIASGTSKACFQFVKRMNGNRMPGINPISSVKKNPRFQQDYASVGTKISEGL